MRVEIGDWSATCGVHIGHHHASKGLNCQDAVALNAWEWLDTPYICGIVCDGCGGAHEDLQKIGLSGHSEVGANLMADMMMRYVISATQRTPDLDEILDALFDTAKRFISTALWTCNSPEEAALVIQRYWLTTINGFIMNGKELKTFHCGDGVIVVNGGPTRIETCVIDEGGAPHYLAYACCPLPAKFGITPDVIPSKFSTWRYPLEDVNKVMVASDGFIDHNENKMDMWRQRHPEEELLFDLNGQQWGKKGKFGLKKWMNTRSMRGYFSDDCGIVVAERMPRDS